MIRWSMSVYAEKSQSDVCHGFQRKLIYTNAKLSNMALLHLFFIYHCHLNGLDIAGGGFQSCI